MVQWPCFVETAYYISNGDTGILIRLGNYFTHMIRQLASSDGGLEDDSAALGSITC